VFLFYLYKIYVINKKLSKDINKLHKRIQSDIISDSCINMKHKKFIPIESSKDCPKHIYSI